MIPGQRELRLHRALVIESGERVENRRRGSSRRLSNTPTLSGSNPGMSNSRPMVALPPCFWALAGLANKAMPNAAT